MKRPLAFCIRCMPHCVLVVALFLTSLSARVAVAQAVKAFPTAEGFGASTPGGRGGRVIEVTNLKDAGPGSFRNAVLQGGPRIVVFRTSGTIELQSDIFLDSSHSFLTIAGQMAPGGGIQLKNRSMALGPGTHDVIIRYMRFRSGTDGVKVDASGKPDGNTDSFGANGYTSGASVYNVILDHCDFQWATDENLDLSYNTTDVTVQWSIMAEGAIWGHESGPRHSMGTLIGRYGQGPGAEQRISIHHSLYAHNLGRNPRIGVNAPTKTNEQLIDFRNNVIYNAGGGQGAMELAHVLGDEVTPVPLSFGPIARFNIVNNVSIVGPSSNPEFPGTLGYVQGPSKIYLAGNATTQCPTTCDDKHWTFAFISGNDLQYTSFASARDYASSSAFSVAPVTTTPTASVENVVLTDVGATKPKRDLVDERIINDVRSRTGALGPFHGVRQVTRDLYPVLAAAKPPQDTDHDGIPDSWEIAHGLNPKKASDGAALAANGYTNVENYLNELAGDPIPGFGQPLPAPTNLRAIFQK